jgi:hypothetical protein
MLYETAVNPCKARYYGFSYLREFKQYSTFLTNPLRQGQRTEKKHKMALHYN